MIRETLQAPFPYFGGKSRIAPLVWRLFGDCPNYVEPFFGSGAVLLSRPHVPQTETVNDANGFISNFWRAVRSDPQSVAEYADWPVNENDLHARHVWLIEQKETMQPQLEGDPDWFDAQIAGWWVWGVCNWIGGRWCDGKSGPWWVEDGRLVHLGDQGRGVSRRLVHLGDQGQGVTRKRVHLGDWFAALSERLRSVRVACGDWSRITGPSITHKRGLTAVFLDPPYGVEDRDDGCYGEHDCLEVSTAVAQWCREHGENPLLRIVLCGYAGEHDLPGWQTLAWKGPGGYQGQANAHRERLWISPHCLPLERQLDLFETSVGVDVCEPSPQRSRGDGFEDTHGPQ